MNGREFLLDGDIKNRLSRNFRRVDILVDKLELLHHPAVLFLLREVVEGKSHLLILVVGIVIMVFRGVLIAPVSKFLHENDCGIVLF